VPELPDIIVYIEALEQRILGQTLERVQLASPFLLRTAEPPLNIVEGRNVIELRRLGKRICIGLEEDLWLVLHLMIAGRLHWQGRASSKVQRSKSKVQDGMSQGKEGRLAPTPFGDARSSERVANNIRTGSSSDRVSRTEYTIKRSKRGLAFFDFTTGTLSLTEAGTQRRASLHVVQGNDALEHFNPGGLEIFEIELEKFAKVLTSANHTLKRALTDPRLFSGIGNAYSDEILWEAQLSPVGLTQKLKAEEIERLFNSTRATLTRWIDLLRVEVTQTVSLRTPSKVQRPRSQGDDVMDPGEELQFAPAPDNAIGGFPEKVTAFRPDMAVHGKYLQPCPRCGAKIQRIRYASNETNYCPNCQTAGKLLADRALSRLLRSDWPRSAEELEGLTRQ
jgi:formamidopyrimidine-DNA glycosylase